MRLADEIITLRVEGEAILLRPTLRVAMRLDRKFHGFAAVYRGVLEGSFTVMAEIIREGSVSPTSFPDYLDAIAAMPLRKGIEPIRLALLTFVGILSGIDADNDNEAPSGEPMTAADYYTRLFEIGTGWLGWTPEQTWEATPAEIRAAYRGRLDMLKAIFGSGQSGEKAVEEKDAMTVLRSMVASGQNKARG